MTFVKVLYYIVYSDYVSVAPRFLGTGPKKRRPEHRTFNAHPPRARLHRCRADRPRVPRALVRAQMSARLATHWRPAIRAHHNTPSHRIHTAQHTASHNIGAHEHFSTTTTITARRRPLQQMAGHTPRPALRPRAPTSRLTLSFSSYWHMLAAWDTLPWRHASWEAVAAGPRAIAETRMRRERPLPTPPPPLPAACRDRRLGHGRLCRRQHA